MATTVVLKPLDQMRDFHAVEVVYRRAIDYLDLESGLSPTAAARAFFKERPPASTKDPLKFGVNVHDGALAAIGDLAFGFPGPDDAYLGLLLLVPEMRGRGLGRAVLEEVKQLARTHGASRLLIGVLDSNGGARRFWERQGFTLAQTSGPHIFGDRQHVVHRLELALVGSVDDCGQQLCNL